VKRPIRSPRPALSRPQAKTNWLFRGPRSGWSGSMRRGRCSACLALNSGDGQLLGLDPLGVVGQRFGQLGVAEGPDLPQSRDLPALLARDVPEELAALDDLLDRLVEGNRQPPVRPARARALEDLDDPVRVVGALEPRLPLGAEDGVVGRRVEGRGPVGQVRREVHRIQRVAVDLDDDAVHELRLDAAPRVALEAHRVEDVLGLGQGVGPAHEPLGLGPAHERHRVPELRGEEGRAAQEGPGDEEVAAIQVPDLAAVRGFHLRRHRRPPYRWQARQALRLSAAWVSSTR